MNFFVPWINAVAIVVGGGLGSILAQGKLSHIKYHSMLKQVCGVVIMGLGFLGAIQSFFVMDEGTLETKGTILVVISLLMGWGLGEAFMIDRALRKAGLWLEKRFVSEAGAGSKKSRTSAADLKAAMEVIDGKPNFSEGFVVAVTAICVGSMAIVGATESAGNTLYIKCLIDVILTFALSMLYGVGVAFAAIPLLIVECGLMALATWGGDFVTAAMIDQMAVIGSFMVLLTGVNLAFGKKIKAGNLVPALFIPILYYWIIEVSTKTAA